MEDKAGKQDIRDFAGGRGTSAGAGDIKRNAEFCTDVVEANVYFTACLDSLEMTLIVEYEKICAAQKMQWKGQ